MTDKDTPTLTPAAAASDAVLRYDQTPPERRAAIDQAMTELDLEDAQSVMFFGSAAQEEVTAVADEMLEGVRRKQTAKAGEALNELVTTLRGMPLEGLDPSRKPGLIGRLFKGSGPLGRLLQEYEQVRKQVDEVSDRLDAHTTRLMTDVALLDRLYDKTLDYFRRLEIYIAAGDERLRRLDAETLPALAREVEAGGDIVRAQQLGELRARRDDLERRVHDLRLTRQVTMQSLPTIRIIQQNDKALVSKITSTLANTIPLWRQQLALTLTTARSSEASETLKKATDLTNELLTANAETLRTTTQTIRSQVERGVVDIASVKKANDTLLATIDDALRIAEEGKKQRASAEQQLAACEEEMRQALAGVRRAGALTRGSGPRGA
jgi:uncharacterized protein YaaN involved in tellurite resistance